MQAIQLLYGTAAKLRSILRGVRFYERCINTAFFTVGSLQEALICCDSYAGMESLQKADDPPPFPINKETEIHLSTNKLKDLQKDM